MSQISSLKDCPYNNKEINLPRANGYDRNQLRYELCVNPAPLGFSYYAKEESFPLKTLSLSELKLVVRNRYCQCVWQLEELFAYLNDNIFVDNEGGRLCYYCIGCVTKYPPNKRFLQDLYLDSQLCLYVGEARKHHAILNSRVPFKDGRITISQKGLVSYLYRLKTPTGFVHEQKLLKDGRQREQDRLIQYNHGDCQSGVDNLTTFIKTYSNEVSQRILKIANWMVIGGVFEEEVKDLLYEEVASNLATIVQQNCKLSNLKPLANQFTFAFSTPCHSSEHSA